MSTEIRPTRAVGLTLLVLIVTFVLRRLGSAGRSVRSSAQEVRGPAAKLWSDILDGPGPRGS
jgi:hypothetical protein